ncbi:MAG: hypothetical protein HWQ38_12350 [Nostoc sp. NMS7]|uniref:hypothetical protein n=1 Tax=Nostoc sp. NMS7 TaxID=2815391 RepID=UPI0025ECE9A6|nr:hypothetical protein [Nostoc sp. NMS7]MBN3947214.1 hypothetical protein [Nostoc sp. NMS7]
MTNIVNYLIISLSTVWAALVSDPIKSIGSLAAIGTLLISWNNSRKDTTRVKVAVKRGQNGPLILQHPRDEFIIFEIHNKGLTSVVINEIGIKVPSKLWSKNQFINLVDLPHADLNLRESKEAIGTLECVGLPGTVSTKSLGVFLLCYSRMKEASLSYQKQKISSDSLDYVGRQRLIKVCQEFQKLQDSQGKNLQIIPYVLTGSGERFVGKKFYVKLGILGDAIV